MTFQRSGRAAASFDIWNPVYHEPASDSLRRYFGSAGQDRVNA
jgi:hypothetical protein